MSPSFRHHQRLQFGFSLFTYSMRYVNVSFYVLLHFSAICSSFSLKNKIRIYCQGSGMRKWNVGRAYRNQWVLPAIYESEVKLASFHPHPFIRLVWKLEAQYQIFPLSKVLPETRVERDRNKIKHFRQNPKSGCLALNPYKCLTCFFKQGYLRRFGIYWRIIFQRLFANLLRNFHLRAERMNRP